MPPRYSKNSRRPQAARCARVIGTELAGVGGTRAGVREPKSPGRVEGYHAPWVSYQCYNMLGRLKELNGALWMKPSGCSKSYGTDEVASRQHPARTKCACHSVATSIRFTKIS